MAQEQALAQVPNEVAHRRAIRIWLGVVAALVFVMVIVGGATRLTDSGLSIVEWRPVTGALPPLTEAQWLVELEKYRQIPEYQIINKGMSLDEFKFIYWWEWSHRQLGRLIGIAFALPLAFFWWRGWLEPKLKPKLLGLLVLGGSQGAIGWWMVSSGLVGRTDVSQYRLALHLTLATIILLAIIWVMRGLSPPRRSDPRGARAMVVGTLLLGLIVFQVFLGGLVAGLDAGLSHTTWPLMDGHFIPPMADLYIMMPRWVNHFENVMTVQFQHRMLAYAILLIALFHMADLSRRDGPAAWRATALAALVLGQAAIGVMTLLLMVPLWAGLLHQGMAMVLMAMAAVHVHALRRDRRAAAAIRPQGAILATA